LGCQLLEPNQAHLDGQTSIKAESRLAKHELDLGQLQLDSSTRSVKRLVQPLGEFSDLFVPRSPRLLDVRADATCRHAAHHWEPIELFLHHTLPQLQVVGAVGLAQFAVTGESPFFSKWLLRR
jgi:hypothetical protein